MWYLIISNMIYFCIVLTIDYHSEILLLIVPWVTDPLIASSLGPVEGISLSSSPVIQTTIGPKTQKNVNNQKNKHAKVKKSNMLNKWTLAINKRPYNGMKICNGNLSDTDNLMRYSCFHLFHSLIWSNNQFSKAWVLIINIMLLWLLTSLDFIHIFITGHQNNKIDIMHYHITYPKYLKILKLELHIIITNEFSFVDMIRHIQRWILFMTTSYINFKKYSNNDIWIILYGSF